MAKWQPMTPAKSLPLHPTRRRELTRWAVAQGFTPEAVADLIAKAETAETWMNNLYVATIHDAPVWVDGWPDMRQLSIRRIDRRSIHDWRHLQRIKADIFGPEAEAVELYPSEHRVVDTANSYHLWVLTELGAVFPFGWKAGLQTDERIADIPNQQRPGARSKG
jgi:hypothetical protein